MADVIATLDDYGQPAWITVMVIGFIIFWPVGLAILAYLIWSGRMGCRGSWRRGRWQRKMSDAASGFTGTGAGSKASTYGFGPSGNNAFDEYREETLKRLEDEQVAFQEFLERLRMAKDRSEFDQFMAERRARSSAQSEGSATAEPGPTGPATGPQGGPQPGVA